jgi:predicted PurR-regulated permease PerM
VRVEVEPVGVGRGVVGGSEGAGGHIDIVRAVTDGSGVSPARASSVGAARVRVSVRSALAVMFLLALTVLMLEIARDSERVISWVLVAAALAGLVYPVVEFGSHWLPRGLVVLFVVLLGLGAVGFVGYRLVNDVTQETHSLQRLAPRRAAQLEKNSDLLRQLQFRKRVQGFVDDIPKRLTGGSTAKVLESAATGGVAFLAGLILTIFFLIYGPRIFRGGMDQIGDPIRRRRVERVLTRGAHRGLEYARIKVLEAIIEGLIAYAVARAAGVPGPAALGVWVGLWTLLPVAGVLVGATPIVLFAGASSLTRAVVVALVFVAIGIAEFVLSAAVEREVLHVGSFLIVFAAFSGLELDGLTGALVAILGVVVLAAIFDELGRAEPDDAVLLTPLRE